MIAIEKTLISDEIFTESFCCDLSKCKGRCCIDGDLGAPLEEKEVEDIEKAYPVFKKYMSPEAVEIIENGEVFDMDDDGNFVTPLIHNKDCVFLAKGADGISFCAIEKAFLAGEISFKKPISCDLYPIRVSEIYEGEALNYHVWGICEHATALGKEKNIKIYEFLKAPLLRKYGYDWYEQLCIASREIFKND